MKEEDPQENVDDNVEVVNRGGRAGLAQRVRNRRRVNSDDEDDNQDDDG